MKDTIYRADAIKAVKDAYVMDAIYEVISEDIIKALSALPSAEVVEAVHDTEWVALRRDEYEDFLASTEAVSEDTQTKAELAHIKTRLGNVEKRLQGLILYGGVVR